MVTQLAIEPEPRATDFRHGRLYLTFRCNSRCGYCNVWQDPIFSGQAEMSTRQVQESLEQMHILWASITWILLAVNQVCITPWSPVSDTRRPWAWRRKLRPTRSGRFVTWTRWSTAFPS